MGEWQHTGCNLGGTVAPGHAGKFELQAAATIYVEETYLVLFCENRKASHVYDPYSSFGSPGHALWLFAGGD